MTQREKSQSIGVLMIVILSTMLLGALIAVVWPVPVVYADEPEILTITVTSSLGTYFYDPGLDPAGGMVYFNSLGGGQVLTVTVTCSGTVQTFEGAPAFGDSPPTDFSAPWQVIYTVEADAGTQSGIVFTVTNADGTDTAVITFTEDYTDPIVISPTLNEASNFLHADGFTLYYGDDMATAAVFWVEGEAQDDDGAGPKLATYSEAFGGTPSPDPLNPPSYHWEGAYNPDENDWGNGTITVTIYDQVGNSAIQVFTYTRDVISPTIAPTTINESSPYLHADGLTLYYSDMMGSFDSQDFEVQGTASDTGDAGFRHVTFTSAFGNMPENDSNSPWGGSYDVVSSNNGDGNIVVTAYDNVGNWSTGVFTYIEDTTNPTVTLTYITPPGYDEDDPDDYFDADGSNWYNADDFIDGNWVFTSTTADDGAGLDSGSAFWDHSANQTDRPLDCGPGGDGTFPGVSGDVSGTITVTVTITDHVGNPASDAVVFNIDNTGPGITSTSIYTYESPWLYVDGSTVYCGNIMTAPQSFRVQGEANDNEVGLHYAEFSSALGATPDRDYSPEEWAGIYTADSDDKDPEVITVTVYDLLDNATYQTFDYFRDTEPPTVVVTCPVIWSEPSWDVSWNGQDPPPDASGLRHFDVQYKVESGDWQDWLTDTSKIEATFGPTSPVTVKDGETYYFQVSAVDNVSNEQQSTICTTTYHSGVKEVSLPIIMKGYCGCGPDNYEPNDSFDRAYGPLTSGQTYQSYISCCDVASQRDYFYIDISTTNTINIDLTNIPAGVDYDLYLYDSARVKRRKSKENGNAPEDISYNPPSVGKYYILVFSPYPDYSTSPYSLRVTYDQ